MRHYDETLLAKLSEMQSLEQYNYLLCKVLPLEYQIKEKYGVKYNTFDNQKNIIK